MLGSERQHSRLCHQNTKHRLNPSWDHILDTSDSAPQSGMQDEGSQHIRSLVRPFDMLSVHGSPPPPPSPMVRHPQASMDPTEQVRSLCRASILTALPNIDLEYLMRLCEEAQWDPNLVIDRILDQVENGHPYPTVPKRNLKRKREDDEEDTTPESAAKKFDNDERRSQRKNASYLTTT